MEPDSTNSLTSGSASFLRSGAERPANLIIFFVLSYALMWACFWYVAAARIPADSAAGGALLLLGTFAPFLSAVGLTGLAEGRAGLGRLLRPVLQWQVAAKFYVFALVYIAAIKIVAALIHRGATGAWPRFGHEATVVIVIAVIVSTPFQAGEEVGWRGYALPRLAARMGLARASLLLGLIWGVWHLPQFFVVGADTYRQSFALFVLQVIAMSVAIAWLWDRTGQSLLLTMLMHSAVNNTKDIVPSPVVGGTTTFGLHGSFIGWTTVALLWICAAYFLFRMEKTRRPFARSKVGELMSI